MEESLEGIHSQQLLETEGRCYNIMANPVSEHGNIVGAVIVVVDVTEKKAERQAEKNSHPMFPMSSKLRSPLYTEFRI